MTENGQEKQNSPSTSSGGESSEIALEELRLRYQEEAERRNSAESKIGTILTVDAIIVSVTGFFQNLSLLLIAAMIVALLSVILGIHGLRVQDYHTPGNDIDDYLQYFDESSSELRRELAIAYITSISGNEELDQDDEMYKKGNRTKNDEKFNILRWSQILTGAALGLILLHSVHTLFY